MYHTWGRLLAEVEVWPNWLAFLHWLASINPSLTILILTQFVQANPSEAVEGRRWPEAAWKNASSALVVQYKMKPSLQQ